MSPLCPTACLTHSLVPALRQLPPGPGIWDRGCVAGAALTGTVVSMELDPISPDAGVSGEPSEHEYELELVIAQFRGAHPDLSFPFSPAADSRLEHVPAFLAAARAFGDLTLLAGPNVSSSCPRRLHESSDEGEFLWARVPYEALSAAALEFARVHLDPYEKFSGTALVEYAWSLIPRFFADRYDIGQDAVPESWIVLEGAAVQGPDDLVQTLLAAARQGIDEVCNERGVEMIDLDEL